MNFTLSAIYPVFKRLSGRFCLYPSMRPSISKVLATPLTLIIASCPEYLQAPYLGLGVTVLPAPTIAPSLAFAPCNRPVSEGRGAVDVALLEVSVSLGFSQSVASTG